MTFRLLVTGSRDWTDAVAVGDAIYAALEGRDDREIVVVHGACPTGADRLASKFCEDEAWWFDNQGRALVEESHPADWDRCSLPSCAPQHRKRRGRSGSYCPDAGPARNQAMVDLGADLMIAFPLGRSHGTYDAMRRAHAAGIEVRTVTP